MLPGRLSTIWSEALFPVLFAVKPPVILAPENGVPMEEFGSELRFFGDPNRAESDPGR
jgi:hypothetical protein